MSGADFGLEASEAWLICGRCGAFSVVAVLRAGRERLDTTQAFRGRFCICPVHGMHGVKLLHGSCPWFMFSRATLTTVRYDGGTQDLAGPHEMWSDGD